LPALIAGASLLELANGCLVAAPTKTGKVNVDAKAKKEMELRCHRNQSRRKSC